MNNVKIKQAQQKSLRRAKAEVARLNDELNAARFWHDVAESGIIELEQVEKIKPEVYKRVKYAVIGISIAVILSIVLFGCNIARETMHLGGAACQDAGWLLQKGAENIRVQEK